MDLIDRNKKVIGGMLYEAVWSEIGPRSWINGRNLA